MLEESYTYLKNKNYENFPEDFTILLNKINVNNFTVSSSQIKADKDIINFKITVNPLDNDFVKNMVWREEKKSLITVWKFLKDLKLISAAVFMLLM